MWTGEGGSEQFAQGGQWLNPMMYQNVSNEDVDWASLAQQWIQMKETFPTVDQMNVLAPPPPPPPPEKKGEKHEDEGEKGEAPMDMELDSKDEEKGEVSGMNGWTGGAQWNNWQQWGWGWNAANPAAFSGVPGYGVDGEATVAYPTAEQTSVGELGGKHRAQGFPSHQSSQFIRHPNRVWRKGDKTLRSGFRGEARDERSESPEQPVIDAAKRKTLPAWIREGLEKMEKEKQKKLLQEQEKLARDQKLKQDSVFDPLNPSKSKFDSESEQSETEDISAEKEKLPRLSPEKSYPEPTAQPLQRRLSKAEILENVMVCVRKQLTQLLMRVTSEEIEKCAREVFSVYPGLKGLGIYDDSGSDSSSEDDAAPVLNQRSQVFETEDVLREQLNQRKRDFSRVEREIELKIQAQEEQERLAAMNEESDDEGEQDNADQVHRSNPDDNEDDASEDSNEAEPDPAEVEQPSSKSLASPDGHAAGQVEERRKKRNSERGESSEKERKKHKERGYSNNSREKKRDRSESREDKEESHSRKKRDRSGSRERSYEYSRRSPSRETSVSTERKRKKKKSKRDSSRSVRDSVESSRSRDKHRGSSRDKYRDSSRDSRRSKKRHRSRTESEDRYQGSERSHRSDRSKKSGRKSKKYEDEDSDVSTRRERKRSRYSISPEVRKKSKKHKRSRSRSYSSSSRKHRR